MNIIKRITATVSGSVSSLVSHVENHDAIVEVALRDTRAAAAQARVRLSRVQKDVAQLRTKLAQLQEAEASWEQRAVSSADSDTQKALECVKRRNQCRTQILQTNEQLKRHTQVEQDVSAAVARIESRVTELNQQRNIMRSRHSAADAQRVINRIEGGSAYSVDDIFDRWEMRITETEYENGSAAQTDSLEASFVAEEDKVTLEADLAALLQIQTRNAE